MYDKSTEHPQEKFYRDEDYRLELLQSQRKNWIGEVIEPTALNAPGEIMFKVFRPKDPTWLALDPGPHVSTTFDQAETRIRDIHKHQEYLMLKAPRHSITLAPVTSDQTYKDTMRTLNKFFDEHDPSLEDTILRHHLVPLMTTGDITLPFPTCDFFAACANPDRFTAGLTPYQIQQWKNMQFFEHGIKIIKGGPATGKSAVLIASALAAAMAGQQVAITADTNDLCNDLTQRVQVMMRHAKVTNLNVIRVLPNHVEDAKFRHLHVQPEDIPFFKAQGVSEWLIQNLLAHQGQKALNAKRAGDKRFRSEVADLSLYEAMNREIAKRPEAWGDLIRLLGEAHKNSHDKNWGDIWKNIGKELDELRHYVLSKANIVIATCDLFLREPINKSLAPTYLVKDEDAASPRQKLMCLVAALPSVKFIALFGDPKQKGPFLLTSNTSTPGTFSKFSTYTQMTSFEDMGLIPVTLLEQHRMFNSDFVSWISGHHYNNALIDGNASKPTPPQVIFCQSFIKEYLGVDNNYAFLVFHGTRSSREEGTQSTVNPAMQQYFLNMFIALKAALDSSDEKTLGFNPLSFQAGIVTSYLGVVNWFNSAIADHLDRRFTAQVIQTVQGSQKNLVIRLNPNRKLSPFAGAGSDNLVADTRWRHAYIVGITDESMQLSTYGKPDDSNYLVNSQTTKHIFSQYKFAQHAASLVNIHLENEANKACRHCHQLGHTAGDEECPGFQKGPACLNCGSFQHMYHECPDPKILDPPKPKRPCRRCGGDHHPSVCDLPWCKACQSSAHAGIDCPNATCFRCKQTGHKGSSPLCPKRKTCTRCGSHDHNTAKCPVPLTHQYALARPDNSDTAAALLDLEFQYHKTLFPKEYEEEVIEDNNNETVDAWGEEPEHVQIQETEATNSEQQLPGRLAQQSQWLDEFHNLQSLTNSALEQYHRLTGQPHPIHDPYFWDDIKRQFISNDQQLPTLNIAQYNLQQLRDDVEKVPKDVQEEHVQQVAEEHVQQVAEEHVEQVAEEHVEQVAEEHVQQVAEEHVQQVEEEHVQVEDEHVQQGEEEHVQQVEEATKVQEDIEPTWTVQPSDW